MHQLFTKSSMDSLLLSSENITKMRKRPNSSNPATNSQGQCTVTQRSKNRATQIKSTQKSGFLNQLSDQKSSQREMPKISTSKMKHEQRLMNSLKKQEWMQVSKQDSQPSQRFARKTLNIPLISTYGPKHFKNIEIEGTREMKTMIRMEKDCNLHNCWLQSLISYFLNWKNNVKGQLKQFQVLFGSFITDCEKLSEKQANETETRRNWNQIMTFMNNIKRVSLSTYQQIDEICQFEQQNTQKMLKQESSALPRNAKMGSQARICAIKRSQENFRFVKEDFSRYHRAIESFVTLFGNLDNILKISDYQRIQQIYEELYIDRERQLPIIFDDRACNQIQSQIVDQKQKHLDLEIRSLLNFCAELEASEKKANGIQSQSMTKSINVYLIEFQLKKLFPLLVVSEMHQFWNFLNDKKFAERHLQYVKAVLVRVSKLKLDIESVQETDESKSQSIQSDPSYMESNHTIEQITEEIANYKEKMAKNSLKRSYPERKSWLQQIESINEQIEAEYNLLFPVLGSLSKLIVTRIVREVSQESILLFLKKEGQIYSSLKKTLLNFRNVFGLHQPLKPKSTESYQSKFLKAYINSQGSIRKIQEKIADFKMILKEEQNKVCMNYQQLILGFFRTVLEMVEEYHSEKHSLVTTLIQKLQIVYSRSNSDSEDSKRIKEAESLKQITELIQWSHRKAPELTIFTNENYFQDLSTAFFSKRDPLNHHQFLEQMKDYVAKQRKYLRLMDSEFIEYISTPIVVQAEPKAENAVVKTAPFGIPLILGANTSEPQPRLEQKKFLNIFNEIGKETLNSKLRKQLIGVFSHIEEVREAAQKLNQRLEKKIANNEYVSLLSDFEELVLQKKEKLSQHLKGELAVLFVERILSHSIKESDFILKKLKFQEFLNVQLLIEVFLKSDQIIKDEDEEPLSELRKTAIEHLTLVQEKQKELQSFIMYQREFENGQSNSQTLKAIIEELNSKQSGHDSAPTSHRERQDAHSSDLSRNLLKLFLNNKVVLKVCLTETVNQQTAPQSSNTCTAVSLKKQNIIEFSRNCQTLPNYSFILFKKNSQKCYRAFLVLQSLFSEDVRVNPPQVQHRKYFSQAIDLVWDLLLLNLSHKTQNYRLQSQQLLELINYNIDGYNSKVTEMINSTVMNPLSDKFSILPEMVENRQEIVKSVKKLTELVFQNSMAFNKQHRDTFPTVFPSICKKIGVKNQDIQKAETPNKSEQHCSSINAFTVNHIRFERQTESSFPEDEKSKEFDITKCKLSSLLLFYRKCRQFFEVLKKNDDSLELQFSEEKSHSSTIYICQSKEELYKFLQKLFDFMGLEQLFKLEKNTLKCSFPENIGNLRLCVQRVVEQSPNILISSILKDIAQITTMEAYIEAITKGQHLNLTECVMQCFSSIESDPEPGKEKPQKSIENCIRNQQMGVVMTIFTELIRSFVKSKADKDVQRSQGEAVNAPSATDKYQLCLFSSLRELHTLKQKLGQLKSLRFRSEAQNSLAYIFQQSQLRQFLSQVIESNWGIGHCKFYLPKLQGSAQNILFALSEYPQRLKSFTSNTRSDHQVHFWKRFLKLCWGYEIQSDTQIKHLRMYQRVNITKNQITTDYCIEKVSVSLQIGVTEAKNIEKFIETGIGMTNKLCSNLFLDLSEEQIAVKAQQMLFEMALQHLSLYSVTMFERKEKYQIPVESVSVDLTDQIKSISAETNHFSIKNLFMKALQKFGIHYQKQILYPFDNQLGYLLFPDQTTIVARLNREPSNCWAQYIESHREDKVLEEFDMKSIPKRCASIQNQSCLDKLCVSENSVSAPSMLDHNQIISLSLDSLLTEALIDISQSLPITTPPVIVPDPIEENLEKAETQKSEEKSIGKASKSADLEDSSSFQENDRQPGLIVRFNLSDVWEVEQKSLDTDFRDFLKGKNVKYDLGVNHTKHGHVIQNQRGKVLLLDSEQQNELNQNSELENISVTLSEIPARTKIEDFMNNL